jgi:hypothetical protein
MVHDHAGDVKDARTSAATSENVTVIRLTITSLIAE